MYLHDFCASTVPLLPDILNGKITFAASIPLNDKEVCLLRYALFAVSKQLLSEGVRAEELKQVNIIFTKDGSFSMIEDERTVFGRYITLIVYHIGKLRLSENDDFVLFSFTEELVHHFWGIENETDVKYKTLEIVQSVNPQISLDTLKGWGLSGL